MDEIFEFLDLNEIPKWNNDIGILLSYWLQQRANHDDIFGRYKRRFGRDFILSFLIVFVQRMHIRIV